MKVPAPGGLHRQAQASVPVMGLLPSSRSREPVRPSAGSTVAAVDALLAFAAALITLRLSATSSVRVGRFPAHAAWAAALAAYALAAGALAWGAAAGWSEPAFRVYYLEARSSPRLARHRLAPARRTALGAVRRARLRRARGRRRARDAARGRALRGRRPRRAGRPRPLARARARDRRELAGDARRRRRRAHHDQAEAARERAHPRGRRRRRARQRLGGLGVGALAPCSRSPRSSCTRASSRLLLAGIPEPRRAVAAVLARAAPEPRPPRRRRPTAISNAASTMAPAVPPCAITSARAATTRRPCTAPSARASGTGSVERRSGSRRARPLDRGRSRARRRAQR